MMCSATWKSYKLSDIAKIEKSAVRPNEILKGTTFVGLENISESGSVDTTRTVSSGELLSTKFRFTNKHILYGKLRPYLKKIARPACDGICSTDILPILPKEKVDRDFLYYFLRQPELVKLATDRSIGANLPRLSPSTLAAFEILLPPLSLQKQIAAILDKVDTAREKRRQVNQLTELFLQSAFLHMFGDPVTNPKGWETAELKELGTLERGRSKHRPRNAPFLLGGSHPLVQTGEIANSSGHITEYSQTYSDDGLKQSKMWPKGTLCITIAANIGKTAILTFDACFPDSIVGFTPGVRVNTEYIQRWFTFMQKKLENAAPMVAQKNINLEILRKLEVTVPPLQMQLQFGALVEKITSLRTKQNESKKELENLFSSLMQRAFNGELVS